MEKKDISDIFKKEGLRLTHQRIAVWNEVRESSDHLDAEDIYISIKNKGFNISRATVYRAIDVLLKHKLFRKMDMGDGRNRYELKNEDDHHDHMICIDSGKIIEFHSDKIEEIQDNIAAKKGYKIVKHVHQLFVKKIDDK